MDNGYQVGYLDDGEFVEVGRFNNLEAVENSDLEIRHADSETRVVLGDEGFDFDGSDVAGIEALDVQSASVPQVTSNVDFNSNDVTGIGALEAGPTSISGDFTASDIDSSGVTNLLFQSDDSVRPAQELYSHNTVTAENNSQIIFETDRNRYSGLLIITGQDNSSPSTTFCDLIIAAGSAQMELINSVDRSDPVSRSYDLDADLEISLDGSGENYTIVVQSIGSDRE